MESDSSTSSQYLTLLLSQRGGRDELPYHEHLRTLIHNHLLALIQDFPMLLVKPAPFFHDNGSTVQLLQADGTIPMSFKGSTYNIPVTIWLDEAYPISSPHVFVSPTRNMVIKRHHKHVDGSGMVALPYLDKWAFPESNLVGLVRSLSAMFGLDPPLFSKSVLSTQAALPVNSYTSTSYPNPRPSSSAAHPNSNTSSSPHGSIGRAHNFQSSVNPENKTLGRNESSRSSHTGDPSMVFRQNAINALSGRMKVAVSDLQKTQEAGMHKLASTQVQLTERHKQLSVAVDQLQQEKDALEVQLHIFLENTDAVERWLITHRDLAALIDIDDVFVPCDALSKQMLDSSAADLALEDLLYYLDKAVQEGCIPMDVYLKQVRSLAHEQFFCRAMCTKIQAEQRQMQISKMAARYAP
eukprot:c23249_g1_i2 orf=157-1386(+)